MAARLTASRITIMNKTPIPQDASITAEAASQRAKVHCGLDLRPPYEPPIRWTCPAPAVTKRRVGHTSDRGAGPRACPEVGNDPKV